jgi:acyl-CoA reductase-like NAD-dependent aldehyde dehydrogenase
MLCAPKLDSVPLREVEQTQRWRVQRNIHPGNGDVITKVVITRVKDTEVAIEAAHRAFPTWRATPPVERGRLLKRAARSSGKSICTSS